MILNLHSWRLPTPVGKLCHIKTIGNCPEPVGALGMSAVLSRKAPLPSARPSTEQAKERLLQKVVVTRVVLQTAHFLPPFPTTDLRRREVGAGHPRASPGNGAGHRLQPRGSDGRPSSSRSRRSAAPHPRCAPHAVDSMRDRPLLQEPRHVGVLSGGEGAPGGAGCGPRAEGEQVRIVWS